MVKHCGLTKQSVCFLLLFFGAATGKPYNENIKNEIKNIEVHREVPSFCFTNNTNTNTHITDYSDILLYIPTNLDSVNHFEYMQFIWPKILNTSCQFMQCVDAIIHVSISTSKLSNYEKNRKYHQWVELFESNLLPFRSTRVMFFRNKGAVYASAHAAQNWFDAYQWVIRMHPDIIIRNSTRLLHNIKNNTWIDGIFSKCWEFSTFSYTSLIRADFYAYRVPSVQSSRWSMLKSQYSNIEHYTSHVFRELAQVGRVTWLETPMTGVTAGMTSQQQQSQSQSQSCRVSAVDIKHYHLDWEGLLHELIKDNIINMTAAAAAVASITS